MRKFSWRKVNVAVPVPVPGMINVRVRRSQAWKISLALALAVASALIILLTGYAAKLPSGLIWHRAFIGFFCSLVVVITLELLLDRVGIPLFVKKNESLRTVWVGEYEDDYIKLPIPQPEEETTAAESENEVADAAVDDAPVAEAGKGQAVDFSVGTDEALKDLALAGAPAVDATKTDEESIIVDNSAAGNNNAIDNIIADFADSVGEEVADDTDTAVDKLIAEATAGVESDEKAAEEPHFVPLVPGTEPHFDVLDTDVLEKVK